MKMRPEMMRARLIKKKIQNHLFNVTPQLHILCLMFVFLSVVIRKKLEINEIVNVTYLAEFTPFTWSRDRVVRASSLGSQGPEFDSSVRPSVVKIANHCYFHKAPFARKAGPVH